MARNATFVVPAHGACGTARRPRGYRPGWAVLHPHQVDGITLPGSLPALTVRFISSRLRWTETATRWTGTSMRLAEAAAESTWHFRQISPDRAVMSMSGSIM